MSTSATDDRPLSEVAVVVGATGLLGGAVARRLASRGFRVVCVARDEAKLAELARESAAFVPCTADISEDAAIGTIGAVIDGPVRMAFIAAGLPVRGSVMTVEPAMSGAAVNVKVGGLLRLARAVDEHLLEGSCIVTLSGYLGSEPNAGEAVPGIANAALHNAVRQLSFHYGARGVRVHGIAPGPVNSERLLRIARARAEESGRDVDAIMQDYLDESSIGRMLEADDVAWLVEMLLDPHAAALHGNVMALDAGRLRAVL